MELKGLTETVSALSSHMISAAQSRTITQMTGSPPQKDDTVSAITIKHDGDIS